MAYQPNGAKDWPICILTNHRHRKVKVCVLLYPTLLCPIPEPYPTLSPALPYPTYLNPIPIPTLPYTQPYSTLPYTLPYLTLPYPIPYPT